MIKLKAIIRTFNKGIAEQQELPSGQVLNTHVNPPQIEVVLVVGMNDDIDKINAALYELFCRNEAIEIQLS